ncbi:MAG: VOC family protein [Clostridia bacterium]|nr:VOC family protein [Deltaproteobacteria bacterium]
MIDHIGIGVGDYEAAKTFYAQALAPLGITQLVEVGPELNPSGWAVGFGRDNEPNFWLGSEGKNTPPVHIAFVARSRAEVRAFYEAALEAGGRDNGAPGLRPHYNANYYAAFVRDLDGHNLEAVCHAPGE